MMVQSMGLYQYIFVDTHQYQYGLICNDIGDPCMRSQEIKIWVVLYMIEFFCQIKTAKYIDNEIS